MGCRTKDQDILQWPLEKIVEEYKKNPFFRQKVKTLSKRKTQLQSEIEANKINFLQGSFNYEGEDTVLMRQEKVQDLQTELNKIISILKAI